MNNKRTQERMSLWVLLSYSYLLSAMTNHRRRLMLPNPFFTFGGELVRGRSNMEESFLEDEELPNHELPPLSLLESRMILPLDFVVSASDFLKILPSEEDDFPLLSEERRRIEPLPSVVIGANVFLSSFVGVW